MPATEPLFTFTLRGWKAITAIAIFALVFLWRVTAAHATLGPEVEEQLRFWLRGEYTSAVLEGLERGDPDAKAYREGTNTIVFQSVGVKGTNPVYVRVEVRVDGRDPPDGRPVRYFEFEHSLVLGWRYKRDISALSYYLKLF